uniref:DNA-directed DNA polymerase n=1 Tax=Photinus pyralis TaxID=7054 RepID=A0A1Y1LSM0_PHOPY
MVDPFRECCTIASACSLVFRRNFLQENTIGLIPPGGYRCGDKQSKVAIKWLLLKAQYAPDLKHIGNSREVRLQEGLLVDGFSPATNTVFQFHGCYYHGCEECYPDQTAPLNGNKEDSMFMRREKTLATSSRIRAAGYQLVEMWECAFRTFLTSNPEIATLLEGNNIMKNEPLNPRNGFFEGRTNAVKLYHKAEEKEAIRYLDVCSLYPYVNKYGKYPVVHSWVLVTTEELGIVNLNTAEGLVKCTILPPQNLYYPVLPYRCHQRLMFPLCRTCCETMQQEVCNHSVEDRQFTGT